MSGGDEEEYEMITKQIAALRMREAELSERIALRNARVNRFQPPPAGAGSEIPSPTLPVTVPPDVPVPVPLQSIDKPRRWATAWMNSRTLYCCPVAIT